MDNSGAKDASGQQGGPSGETRKRCAEDSSGGQGGSKAKVPRRPPVVSVDTAMTYTLDKLCELSVNKLVARNELTRMMLMQACILKCAAESDDKRNMSFEALRGYVVAFPFVPQGVLEAKCYSDLYTAYCGLFSSTIDYMRAFYAMKKALAVLSDAVDYNRYEIGDAPVPTFTGGEKVKVEVRKRYECLIKAEDIAGYLSALKACYPKSKCVCTQTFLNYVSIYVRSHKPQSSGAPASVPTVTDPKSMKWKRLVSLEDLVSGGPELPAPGTLSDEKDGDGDKEDDEDGSGSDEDDDVNKEADDVNKEDDEDGSGSNEDGDGSGVGSGDKDGIVDKEDGGGRGVGSDDEDGDGSGVGSGDEEDDDVSNEDGDGSGVGSGDEEDDDVSNEDDDGSGVGSGDEEDDDVSNEDVEEDDGVRNEYDSGDNEDGDQPGVSTPTTPGSPLEGGQPGALLPVDRSPPVGGGSLAARVEDDLGGDDARPVTGEAAETTVGVTCEYAIKLVFLEVGCLWNVVSGSGAWGESVTSLYGSRVNSEVLADRFYQRLLAAALQNGALTEEGSFLRMLLNSYSGPCVELPVVPCEALVPRNQLLRVAQLTAVDASLVYRLVFGPSTKVGFSGRLYLAERLLIHATTTDAQREAVFLFTEKFAPAPRTAFDAVDVRKRLTGISTRGGEVLLGRLEKVIHSAFNGIHREADNRPLGVGALGYVVAFLFAQTTTDQHQLDKDAIVALFT
jgi:hypothetical protein